MTTKICTKCNTQKEINQFSKSGKNYTSSYCKDCSKIKYNEWYIKNKEKREQYNKEYYRENKEECIEYQKTYRVKNKETIREYHKRYRQTEDCKISKRNSEHKRRATVKSGNINTSELKELFSNTKSCYWCNKKLNKKKIQVDHYIPLSKGGEHLIENIVLACPHCNMSKHDKDPIEFANKLGRLF